MVQTTLEKKRTRRRKKRIFLALAPEIDHLGHLLDCMYTALLVRRRHPEFSLAVLVHAQNKNFTEQSGLFDQVHTIQDDEDVRDRVRSLKKDVLYQPDPNFRSRMSMLFTRSKIRIGGAGGKLSSRLLNLYLDNHESDLKLLHKKGIDLAPESLSFQLPNHFDASHMDLPEGPFVWLSLFDEHDVTTSYPKGHVARLARLLHGVGVGLVIPVNLERVSEKALLEFQKKAPEVVFVHAGHPQERAAGMAQAHCVLGVAGPDTLLASLLSRPVVIMHDMQTQIYSKNPHNRHRHRQVPRRQFMQSGNVSRHLAPAVSECTGRCPSCQDQSCMEYISPERVFEDLKQILFAM